VNRGVRPCGLWCRGDTHRPGRHGCLAKPDKPAGPHGAYARQCIWWSRAAFPTTPHRHRYDLAGPYLGWAGSDAFREKAGSVVNPRHPVPIDKGRGEFVRCGIALLIGWQCPAPHFVDTPALRSAPGFFPGFQTGGGYLLLATGLGGTGHESGQDLKALPPPGRCLPPGGHGWRPGSPQGAGAMP
jgi:hypothetical protein